MSGTSSVGQSSVYEAGDQVQYMHLDESSNMRLTMVAKPKAVRDQRGRPLPRGQGALSQGQRLQYVRRPS